MAVLLFVLLIISAIVLTSAISVAATDADKKGYEVTTLLDGNKLEVSFNHLYEDTNGGPSVVALDSTSSSIHRVSLPISQSSVIERISGGKQGYRDGSANEALFDRPKRLALDSDGTIYVADTKNFAVRMITRAGLVTTIAGGSNRTGHNDGEGSEVTFSNDFDVTYLRSTCTLAIADRGNRLIREIQLPQFIGRCSHATPNPAGSTFTSGAVLMVAFLAGIVGLVAGVIVTILMISTRHLEQLQSRLSWATTKGPSWARSSIWKTIVNPSSTLQVKGTISGTTSETTSGTTSATTSGTTSATTSGTTSATTSETASGTTPGTISKTRFSVTRNVAVEEVLLWSPAFVMEVVITLFEKFLYMLLYSISLLPRLLSSQLFHFVHKSVTTVDHNETTDLLGIDVNNHPSILQFFQVKDFQQASPQVKDFLILEDLIDFLEPATSQGPEYSGISESMSADHVVNNDLTIDSMVEKCLAELTA